MNQDLGFKNRPASGRSTFTYLPCGDVSLICSGIGGDRFIDAYGRETGSKYVSMDL